MGERKLIIISLPRFFFFFYYWGSGGGVPLSLKGNREAETSCLMLVDTFFLYKQDI